MFPYLNISKNRAVVADLQAAGVIPHPFGCQTQRNGCRQKWSMTPQNLAALRFINLRSLQHCRPVHQRPWTRLPRWWRSPTFCRWRFRCQSMKICWRKARWLELSGNEFISWSVRTLGNGTGNRPAKPSCLGGCEHRRWHGVKWRIYMNLCGSWIEA